MKKSVQETIERVIRKQLSDTVIDCVTVQEDTDHDGDEILRVLVIFDANKNVKRRSAKRGSLDPNKTVSMVRHIREELHNLKEDRFPIISYVSRSDAKKMKSISM